MKLTHEDNGTVVRVACHEEIYLTLSQLGGGECTWDLEFVSPGLLAEEKHSFICACRGLGRPIDRTWIFRALQPDLLEIRMRQHRPLDLTDVLERFSLTLVASGQAGIVPVGSPLRPVDSPLQVADLTTDNSPTAFNGEGKP